ncbi:MAG: NUDIX hydrolase [Chloroflexota bacterium]
MVELPNGRSIPDWPWVDTPDYINVLVETKNGRFPIFRQTKYAVDGLSLAPVGGYIEPNEDPLLAAQRELLEETGYVAPEWHHLGSFAVDGNRGAGIANLYLARGAEHVAERDADDLEEQELLLLTRDEVETAVSQGEFKVVSWLTVILLGLRKLDDLTR